MKPTLIAIETSAPEVLKDEDVTFSAQIRTPVFPMPTAQDVVWYGPSGAMLNDSIKHRYSFSSPTLSLTVSSLGRSDAGNYSVAVVNDGGRGLANYSVEVYGETIVRWQIMQAIVLCLFSFVVYLLLADIPKPEACFSSAPSHPSFSFYVIFSLF